MSIGTIRCVAINVTDLAVGYRFWSALTGYEILGPAEGWHGWLGFLGTTTPRKHEMILVETNAAPVHVEAPTHHQANRVHVDITPTNGVDAAIAQILRLGGSVKKHPSLYPRPGRYGDDAPVIDWAVMQDPFGNEFCLVYDLTPEQSAAAMHAFGHGTPNDQDLRAAAGQTTLQ